MSTFLLGVISSLAASMLTVATAWAVSARAHRWALVLLSRSTGLGIWRVYRRQRLANLDIGKDLRRARWIWVLTGRGNELTRDAFAPVWAGAVPTLENVRVLLPDPVSGSWLTRREEAMRRRDVGLRPGLLAQQVQTNADYLLEVARHRDSVALRFYDLPNLYRVVVTDDIAYLTLYEEAEHGRNSRCIVARRPGLLYEFAVRVFTTAWEYSRPASAPASPRQA